MKYSTRIQNDALNRLVSILPPLADKEARREQTLPKSAILIYLALLLWDNSKSDYLPEYFLEGRESLAFKGVNLIFFYPADLAALVGTSDDSIKRSLNLLHMHGFIHLFTPVRDENNYIIYRVGIDSVLDPATPEGKNGYTIITRDLFEEIRKINNVGVLRIVLRVLQENARHNDGRDIFDNVPVRKMLKGLPGYTSRPAFLNMVSDFFKALHIKCGGGLLPSGISFNRKLRKHYDITISGEYSFKQSKKAREHNLEEMKEKTAAFGKLAGILSDISSATKDSSRVDSGKILAAKKLYRDVFGQALREKDLLDKYSPSNPFAEKTFSAFSKSLGPESGSKDTDFTAVAGEYGAGRCIGALRRIWNDMFRGTLSSLPRGRVSKKESNFGALLRTYIQAEWTVPKDVFQKELKIPGREKTFTPIPLPSYAG